MLGGVPNADRNIPFRAFIQCSVGARTDTIIKGFEETSAEDQASLGDKSAESKAKPGPFGSTGRRPECGKGWPSEGDLVRFSKQGTHRT